MFLKKIISGYLNRTKTTKGPNNIKIAYDKIEIQRIQLCIFIVLHY